MKPMLARKESRSVTNSRVWDRWRAVQEEVAGNLPADLLPLWEMKKEHYVGTADERTEDFLQYAHEHPMEAVAAMADEADRKLDEAIRAYEGRQACAGRR